MRVQRRGNWLALVASFVATACVHEANPRRPASFRAFEAGAAPWKAPSRTRGAEVAAGPLALEGVQDQGDIGLSPDKGRRPLQFDDPVAELDFLDDDFTGSLRQRFDWNLIRNADGTLTKIYYFREKKPGVQTYVDLMRRFVPGFASLEAGRDVIVQSPYLRDPRKPGADAWKHGAASGLPAGSVDAMDLLMVTAPESLLRQLDAFLQSVIAEVPQIELEVTIVELALDDQLDTGISYTVTRGTEDDPENNLIDQGVVALAQDLVKGTFGSFSSIHDEGVVNGLLQLLQSTTNSSVLSSPKLAVLNGHRAVVDTGFEIPTFQPQFSASGITKITTSFEPTGIKVVVLPFILNDDNIQLEISIEASNVTGFVTAGIGSGAEVQNPLIARRNAYTVVNVPSGKSVLIGGLVVNDEIDLVDKVPVLGDIPLLGYLFKRTTTTRRKAQVLFLVQPTISRDSFKPGVLTDPADAFEN